jgi:hypothetical protein
MVVVASIYYDSALEKADFPTIPSEIVRQARKNCSESKIYNQAVVITKNDDNHPTKLAGMESGALGDKGFEQGNIGRRKIEG